MKNPNFKLCILFFFILISCSAQNPVLEFNTKNKNASPGDIVTVSIIQLIATPEKYDGKVIYISGFLRLEFEGNSIFLDKEDCIYRINENALWVELSGKDSIALKQQCTHKYVSIIGTFRAKSKGHMGLFSGTISNIRRIDPLNIY